MDTVRRLLHTAGGPAAGTAGMEHLRRKCGLYGGGAACRAGKSAGRGHHLGHPPAAGAGGGHSGRGAVGVGVSAPDLFCQSHRRPLRAGHLLGGQADGFAGDDLFAQPGRYRRVHGADRGSFRGLHAVHGIHPAAVPAGEADEHAGYQRCDDRVHLLRRYRFPTTPTSSICTTGPWGAFPAPAGTTWR